MLKANRFAKHLLSFFAVLFVRLDAADAAPEYLYQPKEGRSYECNTLVGGCAPGAYCTITFSNGKTQDIPLGYRYRGGTLTRLNVSYDSALGEDEYDKYYRGSLPSWQAKQVEWDTQHSCYVYQQYVGRPVLEHVIEYNSLGVQSRDDYYCVCQFPGGTSTSTYQKGYPALEESEAFSTLGWVTICPAGYWGAGAKGEVTGAYYYCRKCPTTTNGTILSENFGEYPATYTKTVDAQYQLCGDDGYYVTGTCVACPENSAECPVYIDETHQTFTCESGYAKMAKYCAACPSNAISCASGFIECSGGNASGGGYYPIISSNGVASCVSCPQNATCDGEGFLCNSGYFNNQPEYGTGDCEQCPSYDTYHACGNFGDFGLICEEGYYRSSLTCNKCPVGYSLSGLSISGATSITQCYLPAATAPSGSGYLPSGYIETNIGIMSCDSNAYYL